MFCSSLTIELAEAVQKWCKLYHVLGIPACSQQVIINSNFINPYLAFVPRKYFHPARGIGDKHVYNLILLERDFWDLIRILMTFLFWKMFSRISLYQKFKKQRKLFWEQQFFSKRSWTHLVLASPGRLISTAYSGLLKKYYHIRIFGDESVKSPSLCTLQFQYCSLTHNCLLEIKIFTVYNCLKWCHLPMDKLPRMGHLWGLWKENEQSHRYGKVSGLDKEASVSQWVKHEKEEWKIGWKHKLEPGNRDNWTQFYESLNDNDDINFILALICSHVNIIQSFPLNKRLDVHEWGLWLSRVVWGE